MLQTYLNNYGTDYGITITLKETIFENHKGLKIDPFKF